MPEGPECTRTARQLDLAARNKDVINLNIISGRYTKKEPDGFEQFRDLLDSTGSLSVTNIKNKGKFIYWELAHGNDFVYMYNTLGMTGNFKLKPSKHTRYAVYFTDDTSIYYNDQRNFGTLKFVFSDAEFNKKLNSIGPDMLNNPCTIETFKTIAYKNPKWTVVKWLMDQSKISGVGNIYKSESLFLAGIAPQRMMGSLTGEELEKLYHAVCQVLSASYESGGSTIRNYSDLYDNHGKYTRFPSNPNEMIEARAGRVMVYNQKEDIYGNPVVRVKLDDGRTTFYSPTIQH